jgi:hypothetical protein
LECMDRVAIECCLGLLCRLKSLCVYKIRLTFR